MGLRSRAWRMALVAAVLIAALPARAQQQDQQGPQESQAQQKSQQEPAFPDRLIQGIQGFFRSLFGQDKDKDKNQDKSDAAAPATQAEPQPPAQTQAEPQQPAQTQAEEEKPGFGKHGGATYAQPVVVTAHASPALRLQSAIAKGDYASALKMIEGGADI